MPARIANPAFVVSDAMDALPALGAAFGNGGVPETTINLVLMRASQINGFDGTTGVFIGLAGRPLALMVFTVVADLVADIDIINDPARLTRLALLDG